MKQNTQNETKYVNSSVIRKEYGISNSTLQRWANEERVKTVRTSGNHRLYERDSVEKLFGNEKKKERRRKVCYARVSSQHQKGEISRDKSKTSKRNIQTTYEFIKDIGSGVNFDRKGFKTLVEHIISGDIEELVISHRDRIDLQDLDMSSLNKYAKSLIVRSIVVQFEDERHSPEEEDLATDLLAITTVFVAKHNGLRAGERKRENVLKKPRLKKGRNTSEDESISAEESQN